MGITRKKQQTSGFALPSVMIASVVMLIVLLAGLVSVSSVSSNIRQQYNNKLLAEAVEAGGARAEACFIEKNYAPTWTALSHITDCDGNILPELSGPAGCDATYKSALNCGVIDTSDVRTTYSVGPITASGQENKFTVTATLNLYRKSTRTGPRTSTSVSNQSLLVKDDPTKRRASQRYWLFGGDAGLDFQNSGSSVTPIRVCTVTPIAIAGYVPNAGCFSGEGSTVATTREGTLEFWTNGLTAWNRNGAKMLNGESGLGANASTTQAASIFPLGGSGGSQQRYMIIAGNTENGLNNMGELYYSIVDMSLDSGRGGVTAQKAINMWPGNNDYASEAIAAAPKADGSGFWVLTFAPVTTDVRVFSVTNSGSVTYVGTTHDNAVTVSQYGAGASGFGTLNFNDDYSRLVMMAGNHCMGTCPYVNGLVRLMSFNNSTGAVTFDYAWNSYTATNNEGYSADFSPQEKYIYTSTLYPGRIVRYKIDGMTSNAFIKGSEEPIADSAVGTSGNGCQGGGQIKRGPNGKMYSANCGASALNVVNTPDAATPGGVGWVANGQPLLTGSPNNTYSFYGLPQMSTVNSPRRIKY